MRYVSTGWLARHEGVTSQTIRRWVAAGKYEHVKYTPNGQIRIGLAATKTFGYARVSSKKQAGSLQSQLEEIHKQYPGITVIQDIGSAFNFKRRGLVTILEYVLHGDAVHVVVADKDRLARAGFSLICFLIESRGGSVTVLNSRNTESRFDTDSLVEFITSFCNSYYGKRSHRRRKDSSLSE